MHFEFKSKSLHLKFKVVKLLTWLASPSRSETAQRQLIVFPSLKHSCVTTSPSLSRTQTLHSFSSCPSTTSKWDSDISKCVVVVSGKTRRTEKDKGYHMLFWAKPNKVKVWHSDGLTWGSNTGTLLKSKGDATCKSGEDRGRLSCSVPSIVLDHVGQLDDVLPLLVLLTQFKGLFLQTKGAIGLKSGSKSDLYVVTSEDTHSWRVIQVTVFLNTIYVKSWKVIFGDKWTC